MNTKLWIAGSAAIALLALSQPLAALADSKTVIESSPNTYIEKHKGDDGDSTYKETNRNGTVRSEYRAEDCKQDTVRDLNTGHVKVVTKGDCAKNKD